MLYLQIGDYRLPSLHFIHYDMQYKSSLATLKILESLCFICNVK